MNAMQNPIARMRGPGFNARFGHEFDTLRRWSGIAEPRNGIYKSQVLAICMLACKGSPAERVA